MSTDPVKDREDAHNEVPSSDTPKPDDSKVPKEGMRALPEEEPKGVIGDEVLKRLVAHLSDSVGEEEATRLGQELLTRLGEELSTSTLQAEVMPPSREMESAIAPGMVLLNKFEVIEKLGEGGMSVVWLVQHLGIGEPRALKVIRSSIAGEPTIRARFDREARILAKLKHPNAVLVYDTGTFGDLRYIEMEYLEGRNLQEILTPRQPCSLPWIDWVLREVCDVLARAHDLGIIHLDLKPKNIMITADPVSGREHIKVLDFGIAMLVGGEPADATSQGFRMERAIGTPAYASPEQIALVPIDHRSDLYSLGVMLYEMLTGARPFKGNVLQLLAEHAHKKPPRFAEIVPDLVLPQAIEELVMQCLEKDPTARPESAFALADRFSFAMRKNAERRETQVVRGGIGRRTEVRFPARVMVGVAHHLSIQLVPGEGETPEEETRGRTPQGGGEAPEEMTGERTGERTLPFGGEAPEEETDERTLPRWDDGLASFFVSFMASVPGQGLLPARVRVRISVAVENLVIDGIASAELLVPLKGRSHAIRFSLIGQEIGPGRVMIDFAQGGRPIGSLDLAPEVVASIDLQDAFNLCPSPSGGLLLNLSAGRIPASPDLIIKVFEHRFASQFGRLQFVVSSPLGELRDLPVMDGDFGTIDLKNDVAAWVEDRLGVLAALAHQTEATPEMVSRTLAKLGHSLFDQLLPRDLQDLYWKTRGRKVRTVLILSDEPHIPWELIKPYRYDPVTGKFEEGEFWGQSYALTHWLRGMPPAQSFSFNRICALAPLAGVSPSGGARIARDMVPLAPLIASEADRPREFPAQPPISSDEELAVLRLLEASGSRVRLLPARCGEMLNAFEQGDFDLLHLAAHGEFAGSSAADASSVLMEDGAFRAADLSPRMSAALRRAAPLIFFNSCHSGRVGFSLTRLGSWGAEFVRLGCGGFVGTLWPVTDRAASVFAQAFYRSMFEGRPIGEAMLRARHEVRERYPDDPTWLAYCCFAYPLARIELPVRKTDEGAPSKMVRGTWLVADNCVRRAERAETIDVRYRRCAK